MARYVRARDSRRVGHQSFGFSPSLSLSLSRLLPSFLAVSAIVSLSFSFDSVSLFSFSALLSPFSSVSLSNSFLSLVSHSFSFSLYPSSFLPLLRHSISLSYFLLRSLLFALQLFSFLSLTFFCFLSLPLYSCSLPPCSFLPSSPFLSVLLLLSSLSGALPKVFPGPPLSPGDPGELV